MNFRNKHLVLLALILFLSVASSSAEETDTLTSSMKLNVNKGIHAFRFSLFYPALKYEYGTNGNTSVIASYIVVGFVYGQIVTVLQMEFRNYYNQNRRLSRKKEIENFNGNYFDMMFRYQFGSPYTSEWDKTKELKFQDAMMAGLAWGLQRNKKAFHFSFQVGGGCYYTFETEKYIPVLILDVSVGFTICRFPRSRIVQRFQLPEL